MKSRSLSRGVGILLVLSLVLMHGAPLTVRASTSTYDLSSASGYTYDSSLVEFSSGQAQLKATTSPAWYNSAWQYRKEITIDHTKVGADATDFPVWVTTSDSDVLSSSRADRRDILFTSSDGTTKLDHEIDAATSTTSFIDSWVATGTLQGVTTDGTNVYVSTIGSTSYPGMLVKYTQSGTLVSYNNSLSSTTQIADLFYKDGYLYVADATAINDNATSKGGRIVRFNASDLSFDSVVLNEQNTSYFTEGVTFYDGHWYLGFWAGPTYPEQNIKIRKYDSSWNFVKEYTLTNPENSGDVQGIDFYEQDGHVYLVGTTHASAVRSSIAGYAYVYEFDASADTFTYQTRVAPPSNFSSANYTTHGQGIFFEEREDGAVAWVANRDSGRIFKEDWSGVIPRSINAWVQVPSVSSTTDTTLYMYYGNASAADQSNATSTWDSSYAMVLHYDEDPAATTTDSTSNANNAGSNTIDRSALSTGQNGASLRFSGSNYLQVVRTSSINPSTITVSAWVKTSNITGMTILSTTEGGGYNLGAWFPDNSNLYFVVNVGGSYSSASASKTLVNDGLWHYVVGTYDGSNVRIYVDGTLRGTTARSGVINYGATPVALRVAAEAGSIQNYFTGTIDETRLSGTARAAGWITTEYNNQSSPSTFYSTSSQQAPYSTNNPTIAPTSTLAFTSLSGFAETATLNGGSIKYQLSNDGGTTWYWYSSGWRTTTSGYSESNTASVVNSNISSFPTGSGQLLWRAYLNSDGTELVQLDAIDIAYSNDPVADADDSSPDRGNNTRIRQPSAIIAPAVPNTSSGLNSTQVQSIISLLESFGAGQDTIAQVHAALGGSANAASASVYQFARDLEQGNVGEDVRQLQKYLNAHGFIVAQTGPGSLNNETDYFGPATRRALIEFQESHASEILAPAGFVRGTGYFGPSTRAYVNAGR